MLKVENLKKQFKSGDTIINAVDGVSLEIEEGSFVSIIGKSGSGKSTLLALLGALDKATSGKIEIGGKEITKMPDRKLISYRREEIGFVFQNYNLIPNISALENVMIPMELTGMPKAKRKERARDLLLEVDLDENKHLRKPSRLSGGEQQRVAIARALANKPKLILADEPTGNLDTETGKMIDDLLKKLAKIEKTTIIAVTHDQDVAKRSDIVFHIKDGKLVKE
ncbi:MAG: ABC transporter ATP-binding protein [Patescibacteria group bacterium]|nr:ABC transporter ATP-binding protein [Patescibacteria group bacterium]